MYINHATDKYGDHCSLLHTYAPMTGGH